MSPKKEYIFMNENQLNEILSSKVLELCSRTLCINFESSIRDSILSDLQNNVWVKIRQIWTFILIEQGKKIIDERQEINISKEVIDTLAYKHQTGMLISFNKKHLG